MTDLRRFIFHSKTVSEIIHEIEEEGAKIFKLVGGGRAKASEVIEITPDERLVLLPAKQLTDDELIEALKALHKQRISTANESKHTPRARMYQEETGLRLSKAQENKAIIDMLTRATNSRIKSSEETTQGKQE